MKDSVNAPTDSAALHQAFVTARTANKFIARPVDDAILRRLYELYKWGPTSLNCQPGRVVFLRTETAKAKLAPALTVANRDKTLAAPVVAIIAYDTRFYDHLVTQAPHRPQARAMFASNEALAQETAFRNGTLQGGYLMIAARLLGLDAGPMSGFDAQAVNEAFFGDGRVKANFLVNLGYADASGTHPRGPRLGFDEAVRLE